MALTEQSPLDAALTRIVGEPGAATQNAAVPVPAASLNYSGSLAQPVGQTVTLGAEQPYTPDTGGGITTTGTVAGTTAAPASVEAAATRPTGLGEGKEWLTYADQIRADLASAGVTGDAAESHVNALLKAGGYDETTMFDPALMSPTAQAKEIAARPANFQPVTTITGGPISATPVGPGQALSPTAGRAPVNPGPRAPWQQSAQYWKDLEAYTKAGGR